MLDTLKIIRVIIIDVVFDGSFLKYLWTVIYLLINNKKSYNVDKSDIVIMMYKIISALSVKRQRQFKEKN